MILKQLDKALEMALSLEEEEIVRIWEDEHVWWYKEMDTRPVKVKIISYATYVKHGNLDPEDSYKHGFSLIPEDERYELGVIFDDAGLTKVCPILQLTLLGYIDSIVQSIKRHKDMKFPTEYKEYVRRVRELAQSHKTIKQFLTTEELHVPTHPADYVRCLGDIAIPLPALNKIFKMYGFEGLRKKSKHGEVIANEMIFGIQDDYERTLALFDYYLTLPNNSI